MRRVTRRQMRSPVVLPTSALCPWAMSRSPRLRHRFARWPTKRPRPPAPPRRLGRPDPRALVRYVALAVVVAAVAGRRRLARPSGEAPAADASGPLAAGCAGAADDATRTAGCRTASGHPAAAEASVHAQTPAPPAAAVPSAARSAAAPAADGRFDVVVASFRTESRASAIGAAVAALHLPVRQRVTDGWQQVVAGPFASRAEAETARERLDHAGLTGAQIVPSEQ